MSVFRNSPLPKEVSYYQSAVPLFTSTGDPSCVFVSASMTDVEYIALTNTTSGTINITVTDGNNVAMVNLSSYPVDPNTPYALEFLPPVRCMSGVKMYANSAGLDVTFHAWKTARYTAA